MIYCKFLERSYGPTLTKDYQYSCVLEGEGIVGHPVPT